MNDPTPTPRPLSVCMISDDFLPGATGVGTHVQTISDHLVRRGHRISVITTRRKGEPEFEIWRGVRVHRVPTVKVAGFYQALPTQRRLARILDEEQPDLIHQHYLGFMLLQVMKAAKARGIKQVYTYHMTVDVLVQPWFMRPFKPLIARLVVRVVNRMDQIIAVSEGLAATLPNVGIRVRTNVISNPVDFPDPVTVQPAAKVAAWTVMYAGRLEPEKDVATLIRAVARLRTQHRGVDLWIAGTGSLQFDLEALCADLDVSDAVRFLGFLDRANLASHYAACDAFVLPSKVETQGLTAMEAMHYGRATLVSDGMVAAAELVGNDEAGIVFRCGDVDSLTHSLLGVFRNPARQCALGRRAASVARQWSPQVVVPRVETTYATLLTGGAG